MSLRQEIIHEDCISGMKNIKSESVDIIICDPPYNIGKNFGINRIDFELYFYFYKK